MDLLATYGNQILDVLFIIFFFYMVLSNLPLGRLTGAFKGILIIVILWFIARLFEFSMAQTVLGQIIQYGFLALIIMYPLEFKKLLETLGRRRIFSWNTKGLISMDSRRELARAIMTMARNKYGGIFVIARQDTLDEEIANGVVMGESEIHQEVLEMYFHPDSDVKNGALIIKDDFVASVRSHLPIARYKPLIDAGLGDRHFAGLGVTNLYDCMSIVVSGDTGRITFIGKEDGKVKIRLGLMLKEQDLIEGIDEEGIMTLIEHYLSKGGSIKKPRKSERPRVRKEETPEEKELRAIKQREKEERAEARKAKRNRHKAKRE